MLPAGDDRQADRRQASGQDDRRIGWQEDMLPAGDDRQADRRQATRQDYEWQARRMPGWLRLAEYNATSSYFF
jgi:hypothetical protein